MSVRRRTSQSQARRFWSWRCRRAALTLLVAACGLALWPRPTLAACGALDLGACVDGAEYSFYYGLAGMGWAVDRTLLQLAYQLDQFRTYLVETAFTTAYQILTTFVSPVYIPVATVALILACLLFMLVPLTGNLNVVHIRHVLIWVVLTPVLLSVGGQLISQAEQIRSQVGTSLFAQAASGAPGAIFGPTATDMPNPQPLYPANPCGSGTLVRRDGAAMHMDDLAAALLYATAQDIHCPDRGGPSPDIPDAFYATPPGYAFDGYIGNLNSEVERRAAVEGMQRGMTRLGEGVLPCLLAVAESLLNLLFSLSLLVLWIGIPLGLMFVYFQHTASGVTGLFRRAVSVFQVSWSSSIVMGLLFSCLLAAARLGNATAYTGFAIGALLLTLYLCVVAGKTLLDSVLTLNATVQSATGLSVTQPIEIAAAAGVATAAVATGGATMAVAGLAASEQTRSNTYALAAMAGRVPGVAQIGEVAASMGWLDTDGPAYGGLYAGERSVHNWRSFRLQLERDATRLTSDPVTIAPTPMRGAAHAPSGSATGPLAPAELMVEHLSRGAQRLVLAADLAETRHDSILRSSALHLNETRQVVYTERAGEPALAALHAVTVPRAEANLPRLLLNGYRVQENPDDGTVSYWKPGKPAPAVPRGTAATDAGAVPGTLSASPTVPSGDGLARIEAQVDDISARLAALQNVGEREEPPQMEQIATAIEPSRLTVNVEQDELERAVQPIGSASAAGAPIGAPAVVPDRSDGLPNYGGLMPVPQSIQRNEALLAHLTSQIASAEQALAQLSQAQNTTAGEQRDQLEQTLIRLRRARSAVEQRVAALSSPTATRPPEISTEGT